MSRESTQPIAATIKFAAEHGIDIESDIAPFRQMLHPIELIPRLAVDEFGNPELRVTKPGVDYLFSRIDYRVNGNNRWSSRLIAVIPAGKRTELAYRPPSNLSENPSSGLLTVSQGAGRLVSANPSQEGLSIVSLTQTRQPESAVPNNRFYTVEADLQASEPLIISRFLQHWVGALKNFSSGALELQPGDHITTVPQTPLRDLYEAVPVPYEFWDRYKEDYRPS